MLDSQTDLANHPFTRALAKEQLQDAEFLPVIDGSSALEATVVPPVVRDFLPANRQYLADPSFVAGLSLFTVPRESATALVFSPYLWRRSLVPACEPIEYGPARQPGSIVQTKGNLSTGGSFGRTFDDDIYRQMMSGQDKDPWGFFGAREAQMEVEISHRLIQESFPAGLAIGYNVYDPSKLRALIEDAYRNNSTICGDLIANLEKVVANGDVPAMLVRMTDSYNRLDTRIDDHNFASILADFCDGDEFLWRSLSRNFQNRLIRNRSLPDNALLREIIESRLPRILENEKALVRVLSQDDEFRRKYKHLALCLSTPKDVTTRFSSVDFESAEDFYNGSGVEYADMSSSRLASRYRETMTGNLIVQMRKLTDHVFHYNSNEPEEDPEYDVWRDESCRIMGNVAKTFTQKIAAGIPK